MIWALLGSLSSSTPVEVWLGAEASLWALSHCPLRGHLLPKSGEGWDPGLSHALAGLAGVLMPLQACCVCARGPPYALL